MKRIKFVPDLGHTQGRSTRAIPLLLVVGNTHQRTGGNLSCSGRPFRRISPYLLSDDRDYILRPHGGTSLASLLQWNIGNRDVPTRRSPVSDDECVDATFHVYGVQTWVKGRQGHET